MIGQNNLKQHIKSLILTHKYPRCSAILGQSGSGRKAFAVYIAGLMRASVVKLDEVKVDTVRDMIRLAYTQSDETVYIIPDIDKASVSAKNALLKILEEPPNNAYFIITAQDAYSIPETIRSRCSAFMMEPYTVDDIMEFVKEKYGELNTESLSFIGDVCSVPGDVVTLLDSHSDEATYDEKVDAFKQFVDSVLVNIATVSKTNSFKISNSINLKNEPDDKFDLKLFWRAFTVLCTQYMQEGIEKFGESNLKYITGITITSQFLQQLNINGINKQMMFDNWVINIRNAWIED